MDFFPVEGDPLPAGKNGWLLALDEMNGADESTQKAAYKLVLDRMVGNHKLHKNVAIIAAGNLASDRALVSDLGTAMQSRLIHFKVNVSVDNWLKWASKNIDHRIVGFIGFKPNLLMGDLDHEDFTFACPRTWHFLSRMTKDIDNVEAIKPLAVATIGEGTAMEYTSFLRVYQELPTWESIVTSPESVKVPVDMSVLFALATLIGHRVDTKTLSKVLVLIQKMVPEAQVVTLRLILSRHPEFATHPDVLNWVKTNSSLISALK